MPMVEGKKFPYTPAGKKAAKAYAAGEKMESKSEKMMEMLLVRLPTAPPARALAMGDNDVRFFANAGAWDGLNRATLLIMILLITWLVYELKWRTLS